MTTGPVRVLDLACGGGDVALALAGRARRENTELDVVGWDISPLAVSLAAERAQAAGYNNVRFVTSDVLRTDLPEGFDIIMCSLFLHHLTEADAIELLRKMASATRRLLLVNDLRRSRLGYCLAWVGCRLLSRSPIVRYDGPVSVAGAFTIAEVQRLATLAGLENVTITPCWPARYLLAWSRA